MARRCDTCGSKIVHYIKDLWYCEDCLLISSDLRPKVGLYNQDYFNKYVEYSKNLVSRGINEVRYRSVANLVAEDNLLNGKKLLDFGCGCGSFVDYMRRTTMVMTKGYDIIPGSPFNTPHLLHQPWDIITFWDSLEHTISPRETLKHLSPEYALISLPSTDGTDKKFTDWKHYRPQEHLHYYNEKSLKALLRACGYKVELLHYNESEYRKGENNKNILTIGGILQ